MPRLAHVLTAAALAGGAVLATTVPAGAVAAVDDYEFSCSNFAATGTASTPYVTVEVYDWVSETTVYFDVAPVTDGSFSFDVSWTPVADGTDLYLGVWGNTTTDPDRWDGESYFSVESVPCAAVAPTTSTTEAPTTTTEAPTTTTAAAAAAAVAPSFTG